MENIISVVAMTTPTASGKTGLPVEGMPEFPFFQLLDQQIGSLRSDGRVLPDAMGTMSVTLSPALPGQIIEGSQLRIDGMEFPPGGDLLPPLPTLADASLAGTGADEDAMLRVPTPDLPVEQTALPAPLADLAPLQSIVPPTRIETGGNTAPDPVLMSLGEFRQQRGVAVHATATAAAQPTTQMQSTQATEMTADLPQLLVPQRLSAAVAAQLGTESAAETVTERLANLSGATQTLAHHSSAGSLTPGLNASPPTAAQLSIQGEDFASELQRFTPAEQPLSTPVRDPRWGEAVGQRLTWMANNGGGRAEIQLDPPELGRLNVEIQIRGESAQVHFQSDQGVVRDALDSALPRLREMLAQAGFGDLQLDVSQHNRNGQGQGHAAEGEFAAGDGTGQEVGGISGGDAAGVNLDSGNGLVDYYA